MIHLIDQAIPKDYDTAAPFACTYRCEKCGADFKALTRARAEQHRCGAALPVADSDTNLRELVATMAAQIAELRGAKAPATPAPVPTPAAVVENGAATKPKRGRPKKVATPA